MTCSMLLIDHHIQLYFSSGLFFILPCIDDFKKVDMRTLTYDVPPQEVTDLFNSPPYFIGRKYLRCILSFEGSDDDRLWSKHVNQINFTLHSRYVLVICFMT
jgi:hypothetical protein